MPTQTFEAEAKTRLLLALWDMNGLQEEVKKGDLTKRVVRTKEKSSQYQNSLEELENMGAIAVTRKGRAMKISLTQEGLNTLEQSLHNPEFGYGGNQVGSKVANSLLKWIREKGSGTVTTATVAPAVEKIESYEEFKTTALEVYDKLNREYNLDDLVPIYRIRREIGEQVTRSQFNEWMLEMQENDVLQLQGGSLPDGDPEKIADSIETEISGLRCYAKLL